MPSAALRQRSPTVTFGHEEPFKDFLHSGHLFAILVGRCQLEPADRPSACTIIAYADEELVQIGRSGE